MRRVPLILLLLSTTHLFAATRTWSGAAGDNWTVASNWKEGGAPVAGDDLVFPAGAANQKSTNNDFPDHTSFHSITFTGGSYRLNGNAITLGAGGIHTQLSAGGTDFELHNIALPLTLGASQTWVLVNGMSGVSLSSPLDLNGMALAINDDGNVAPVFEGINGSGSVSLTGPAGGFNLDGVSTSTAPFTITNETLFLGGTYLGPITIGDYGEFDDFPDSTAGTVTASGVFANFEPGTYFPNDGTAGSGNVVLASGTQFTASINSPTDVSTLKLTGTINLGGADLELRTGGTMVPAGTTATIIDNDGSDPVTGTFNGLPEGGEVVTSFQTLEVFRVSYVGGTGNDVTITAVGPGVETETDLSTSVSPSATGEPVTLTAKVTATSGIPAGSVVFSDYDPSGVYKILATVPLDATGTAAFTTSSLSPGTHYLQADYGALNPPFAPSTGFADQVVGLRHRAVR